MGKQFQSDEARLAVADVGIKDGRNKAVHSNTLGTVKNSPSLYPIFTPTP